MTDPLTQPPAVRKSAALHKRVQLFAASCDAPSLDGSREVEFEELALDIARFQQEHSPGFARMVNIFGGKLDQLSDLPIIPTDAFRMTRVAVHPEPLDQAVYQTSGTTASMTGRHPVRDLSTKEELTLLQARRTLFAAHGRGVIVAIAPEPERPSTSSLAHMMEFFMEQFDGQPLSPDPQGASFSSRAPGRWLINSQGIDVEGLKRAARLAKHRSDPLYVLSTSFAMAGVLDALDGEKIRGPSRTVVMLTGGFKGRESSLNEPELREATARAFGISADAVWGEYGMTELSSQMFEHRNPVDEESASWWQKSGPLGHYFAPPWLRVQAIDPTTYRPVSPGEPGLAHFIDLANVDSCLSIVTQDLIKETDRGVVLLGRAPRAPARGCSLPFEGFVMGGAR